MIRCTNIDLRLAAEHAHAVNRFGREIVAILADTYGVCWRRLMGKSFGAYAVSEGVNLSMTNPQRIKERLSALLVFGRPTGITICFIPTCIWKRPRQCSWCGPPSWPV